MHKSVGWYDDKNRTPGVLTNMLTEEISSVNGMTTESLGVAVEAILGLFFSCLMCFLFSWQVALVVCVSSPLMVLSGLGITRLQFS
jgi:ABC-type multidrug transport system fused ATPase/permease subunit